MSFDEKQLSQKIKHLRELRNFTQSHMSQALGISIRAYSKIEQGATQLSVKRLFQVAEILSISVKDILGFSTEMIFNNNPVKQSGGSYMAYNNTAVAEIKALYERLLEEKETQITRLLKAAKP
jgi:transcriptional regulator with XRE-family HTH domain